LASSPHSSPRSPTRIRHDKRLQDALSADSSRPLNEVSRIGTRGKWAQRPILARVRQPTPQIRPVIVHGADVMDRIFSGEADRDA
jgi:hypothetical protein